jgi:hypothetical protein
MKAGILFLSTGKMFLFFNTQKINMNIRFSKPNLLVSLIVICIFLFSCKKPAKEMLVSTGSITDISTDSAKATGQILDLGDGATQYGHCYSKLPNATIADSKTQLGIPSNGLSFTSQFSELEPSTKYYVKAYISNSSVTVYGNEINFTSIALKIGDTYQGGIVAYIFQPGDPGYSAGQVHGLIAAPEDQSQGIQWYNGNYSGLGTAIELATGRANSDSIIVKQGAGSYAAKICRDLTIGGYTDWYLPSKDELSQLYNNRNSIGGFSSADYWSSSEGSIYSAWIQNFGVGSQTGSDKSTLNYVRAVRSF